MTLLQIGTFFGVSFIAAAINSVAGGGTFLTFPVFILNGLTSLQANIMSTIALWPGTLASVFGYKTVLANTRKMRTFLIVAAIGGIIGSLLLLSTPEIVFRHLVPWLLLVATLIFTFGNRGIGLMHRYFPPAEDGNPRFGLFLQLVIAIYGGYFGAGMGILTLAMLQVIGMSNIHQMNALKTVLTGAVNAITALIFVFSGKVLWGVGMVMIAGAVLGGYLGARAALHIPPEKIRLLVSIIGFSMTIYFFTRGV